MRVLVTGGTGILGRPLVQALRTEGATVRVLSRQPAPTGPVTTEWAQGQFVTGDGLAAAVDGVDVLIHAAHDARSRSRDVQGVRELLGAAERGGVGHVIYVSILGARDVPGLAYYRGKAEAEALVAASPLSTSVFRATQFFGLIDGLLGGLNRLPVLPVPLGARFQPVDVQEVAVALARHAATAGRAPAELAGPEVLTLRELARHWCAARHVRKRILEVPLPLPALRALAAGALTSHTAPRGERRWADWLAQHAGGPAD
ncbi:SDR family oxidoreductase [uncultured Deinococcus sp.]|uniref:SDR family oxidoreductase n=1 Tax=uncultured Deinococcus sp. TaxID=158789 RepID=UPI0025F0EAE0|nr:NAD(P)H-binding protein [uncultured Deinococcus sp.]